MSVARKIAPKGAGDTDPEHSGQDGPGRWRQPPVRPTRAPHGDVRWWERPAPEESDPRLWAEVQRIQARRQQLNVSVTELARRLTGRGYAMRRETLSRVLNGKQPTTWDTAERLADVLGLSLSNGDPGREAR